MRSVEVMVIGGGASGMLAAIMAKRAGAHVMILEKKNRVGKKILATGNGKCNFTNLLQTKECYRSEDDAFAWKVIEQFGAEDSIAWFDEIGVLARQRDGYIYPASNQAGSVLRALERELKRSKIEVHLEETVCEIQKTAKGKEECFLVQTDREEYLATRVILATGGMASPVHGSTGDGYHFAKKLGHRIVQPVSALTSLVLDGKFMKEWSGVRVQGKVALYNQEKECLGMDVGEIQMVAHGISGIPVFQLSRYAAQEIAKKRKPYLVLDSMPQYEKEWIVDKLWKNLNRDKKQSMGDLLEGMLPDKLASVLIKENGMSPADMVTVCTKDKMIKLVETIKNMKLLIREVSGFDKAQVTAGGVTTAEVNAETMESKLCTGLYFTGELLDVDGICGGYNLQWAWATGYLAGSACGKLHVDRKKKGSC